MSRQRFDELQQKYFGIQSLMMENSDPLSALINRSRSDYSGDQGKGSDSGRETLAEASKHDIEITSLIKKDLQRTMPEIHLFQGTLFSQSLQQILYIWAKENPDYKYQQGMSDILGTILVCLLSDTLIRELPTHYEPEFDYDAHLRYFKEKSSLDKPDFFLGTPKNPEEQK